MNQLLPHIWHAPTQTPTHSKPMGTSLACAVALSVSARKPSHIYIHLMPSHHRAAFYQRRMLHVHTTLFVLPPTQHCYHPSASRPTPFACRIAAAVRRHERDQIWPGGRPPILARLAVVQRPGQHFVRVEQHQLAHTAGLCANVYERVRRKGRGGVRGLTRR